MLFLSFVFQEHDWLEDIQMSTPHTGAGHLNTYTMGWFFKLKLVVYLWSN
jgi:hypothetical protein